MPDPNAIFDALDAEYQRREAEAGAFPADLAEIAKTTPYVAEKLARQRGWSPTAAVDPEAFAYETADRLLKEAPDTPDEDVLAIKAWAQRRKGVNVVREETAAKAGQDMTSAAGSAFNATAVPLASEASRATFGIPEFVARKVVAPVVEAVTGAKPATKEQVQAAQAQGREAHPFLSDLSGGVGATAGAMTLMVPAAGAMTPVLAKVGMSPGVASTVANLLAGAAHGGAVEGSAEGALRSGLFMGGQSALGRVFRGAAPGAARYVASEAAAGSTASVLAQLAAEGHADPTRVLADGVVNALFGIGGARAASRAKAREHVAAEVAKGREIPEIVSDDVFKAMWEESRNYPDPMVEAASTRGEFDARLAEMQASKADIPAIDPVAEAKATAAEFDARPTPEPTAPEKPVSVAPVAPIEAQAKPPAPDAPASKTLVGTDKRVVTADDLPDARGSAETKWYHGTGAKDLNPQVLDTIGSSDPNSLVGMGLYLTDSPQIAETYAAARGRRTGTPTVYEAQVAPRNVINFEKPLPPQVAETMARAAGGLSETAGQYVKDAIANGKSGMEVYKAMREGLIYDEIPLSEATETLQTLQGQLRDLGYDAISHIGGLRAGKGENLHRVLVVLDPNYGYSREGKFVQPYENPVRSFAPKASAHPQEVAEAKASAQTPAPEPARLTDLTPPEAKTGNAPVEPPVEARPMEAAPAEASASRPGKQAERGALSLAPVGEFLGEVAGGVRKVFGETISRVRAYKTPAAEETARKATEAVDAAKAFRGEMGRELLVAEKLAGQPVVTKLGRAATELATPTKVPGETFTEPTLYEAIEGRRQPASPEEARIIASIRQLIWKAGEITEREGMPQRDSQGNYNTFVNRTDKVAPRITAEGYHEIIQMGPSSRAWNPMVDAFAKRNPQIPRTRLEDHFKTMHEEMAREGPQAAGAKAQAEFTREIPNVPATVEVDGRTFRLFETNPATYLRRFAETRAQRLGFGKAFGYDVPGKATPVQNLRERFAAETGKPQEFVNLTRELHGHAKDAPIIDPGSITGGLLRNADRAWSVVREGLLSASAIVNTPESLGATQHLVGTRRLAKAIYAAFRGKSHPMNAAVDALGATTRDAINASYDPANPRGSVARMMTEMLSRTFGRKFVEEFQERVAAVGGKMMADDMQAGKGSGYDIQSLKTMGWSDADARRLAKGGGTQAEYDAISRRLPTVAVGANQSKAEKSWFQNTRVLRPLNAIASYAHTTIRNAFSAHKAFVDTMGRVVDGTGLTPKERWAGTFRAFQHLSGFYVAKTLQGAAATMLAATVGRSLGIKKSEAEDEPFDFAAKSFISSTFGGPYAATARAMFGDGNLSQISPQVSVALEAIDALNGNGKYRDLPLSERMAQLATRFLPVSRVMRSMAVAVGLGNEQSQDIENARSAYWSWRKKFDKTTFTGKEAETDAEQAYRTALKSAYLAMTRGGEPEEVAKRVLSAIGGEDAIGKDKKKAAESIRRRMLLTAPAVKGKLDALKSRIGDKAYKTLETHDALLESLADSVQRGG